MNTSSTRSWYVSHWPPLAWLETALKLAALLLGMIAGWQALATPDLQLPSGLRLVAWIVLVILSLGLLVAIIDRWTERELVAMVFVVFNNLGHWGLAISMLASSWPGGTLLPFAILMLLGDLVKVAFIRKHQFTVRGNTTTTLIGLTSVYIIGYAILVLVELLGEGV
jgi:hypothetical protein